MVILFSCISALIGILLGGSIARASYALPRGEYREILSPRCPFCGEKLPRTFLIPIAGTFLSRCRCPHCGERRSRVPLISEILLGVIYFFLAFRFHGDYLFYIYAALAADLLLLSLIDLDIREVPHSLLLVILLLGVMLFVFSFFSFSHTGTLWWEHLIGAFSVSLLLFIVMIVTGGGVGGGDIKLMFCLGLLFGYKLILLTFVIGVLLAALFGLLLILLFGKSGRFRLPLVPFLSLGAVLSVLLGDLIWALLF